MVNRLTGWLTGL